MNIQKRLHSIFVGFALFVIALFGVVAFRIALNSGAKEQMEMLHGFAAKQAQVLSSYLTESSTSEVIPAPLWLSNDQNQITTVIDEEGINIAGPDLEALIDDASNKELLKRAVLKKEQNSGYFSIRSGYTLIWARTVIPSTPYYLVVTRRSIRETSSIVEELSLQLIVTACIIIVIAVGAARILSISVARQLTRHNEELAYQSLHDNLTGLANRTNLHRHVMEKIRSNTDNTARFVLFVMDIDRFKDINDTLGHNTGDQLLKEVGMALQQASQQAYMVSRLGGDEFAVLVPLLDHTHPSEIARQILSVFDQPFPIGGIASAITASTGAAIYPDHGTDPTMLTIRAEIAMYESKRNHLGFTIYSTELDANNLRNLTLNSELRHAIENRQLELYYQPKIDLKTNRTVGVEALMRWHHPTLGMIPPSEFIPLAEQSDIIRHLTVWAIDEALRQCRAWRQMGYPLAIALNLSARSLHDPGLPIKIASLLAKWAIPSNWLTLEVTESAIMAYPQDALKILKRLDLMRINLSIDDFGTGYSSLVYLKQMPVSQIKVDKSFVIHMVKNENDAVIVRSTIDLGHNMGCEVVAEGVEDSETMSRLKLLGCDAAQGFFMSPPLPSTALLAWLKDTTWPVESESSNTAHISNSKTKLNWVN